MNGTDVARTRLELTWLEENENYGAHVQLQRGENMVIPGSNIHTNVSEAGWTRLKRNKHGLYITLRFTTFQIFPGDRVKWLETVKEAGQCDLGISKLQ